MRALSLCSFMVVPKVGISVYQDTFIVLLNITFSVFVKRVNFMFAQGTLRSQL